MKIIFTGAQGTGKTTILNHYKEKGFKVITEVVRNLAKEHGIKINEMGDEEGQQAIFNMYNIILNCDSDYISDRGLVDVYSYSTYHFNQGKLSLDELSREMGLIEEFAKRDDVLWFYFPIEFDVVNDGVRSIDEEYRKYIDDAIHQTLNDVGIKYITVKGTVEERIKLIDKYIK